MHAKQVCTVAALALICACDMEDDFEVIESSESKVNVEVSVKDILERIEETPAGQEVRFPEDARPQQVEAAMNQLHAKLRPKADNARELEADEEFESSLNAKQKRGLKKIKDGYAQKVRDGAIMPVQRAGGRWELEVQGPRSGRETGPPRALTQPEDAPSEGGAPWLPPPTVSHFVDSTYSWNIDWKWWGVKISVDHDFLYILCNYATWFANNAPIASWIKWALRLVGCYPHSRDTAGDGGACYVTWIGVGWCSF